MLRGSRGSMGIGFSSAESAMDTSLICIKKMRFSSPDQPGGWAEQGIIIAETNMKKMREVRYVECLFIRFTSKWHFWLGINKIQGFNDYVY
jgi:hypothetical protein